MWGGGGVDLVPFRQKPLSGVAPFLDLGTTSALLEMCPMVLVAQVVVRGVLL